MITYFGILEGYIFRIFHQYDPKYKNYILVNFQNFLIIISIVLQLIDLKNGIFSDRRKLYYVTLKLIELGS